MRQEGGRALNSIITTSDVALKAAQAADAIRAEKGMTSMLLGIPVALKDNYNTVDMRTSSPSTSRRSGRRSSPPVPP